MISTEFLITSLIVVLIPGTGVLYTISCGLFQGAKAGIYAAIGCTIGIIPAMTASILGLAVIFHTSALAFQIIKYLGVIYLLYIAWNMWKETGALALSGEKSGEKSHTSGLQIITRGFLINILNPKLSLFFLAFLPQFIPASVTSPISQMLLLGGIFMAMTFIVFVFYAVLAHGVRGYIINSPRTRQYLQRSFAAGFAFLGAKLALSER